MYNQVIVVEGRHDEQKLKSIFPGIECIVTNGSEISKETLDLIYRTSLVKEVILFLDPDYPGKRITQKILDTKGRFKIAFINKQNAISANQKKVGVEHASKNDIIQSLENHFTVASGRAKITTKDLMKRGLMGASDAKKARDRLCKSLNLPVLNSKSFAKTLTMIDITLERIDELIEQEQ